MTDHLTIYDRAAQIDSPAWDRLAKGSDVALSHAGITLAENTANTRMTYAILIEQGRQVAALCAAEATVSSHWILGRPDRVLEDAATTGDPDAASFIATFPDLANTLLPSLILGGRQMGNSSLLMPDSTSDVQWRSRSNQLVSDLEGVAKNRGYRSVAWPFVAASDRRLRTLLQERGYMSVRGELYNLLEVAGDGFEGYLSRFDSRKRWHFRKEVAQINKADLTWALLQLSQVNLDHLAQLETNLLHRYGHIDWKPEMSLNSLAATASTFRKDALVSIVEDNGVPLGFVVLLEHDSQWFARQAGFDYLRQQRLPVYFQTLFYGPLSVASQRGIRHINYGLGTDGPKKSRGCITTPQFLYLKTLVES